MQSRNNPRYTAVMPNLAARPIDVVVIGAGIVGLAVAREILTGFPGASVSVVEKEPGIAAHQTGHNSGVIHAGIYYKPGSLKARLCVRGARLLREYADRNAIPYRNCGKIIAAVSESEVPRLRSLWERGAANEVLGLKYLSGDQVREYEPAARGAVAGIHSPQTGIIDFSAVSDRLAHDIAAMGGTVRTNVQVLRLHSKSGEQTLETSAGPIAFHALINCGGLYADRLARLLGAEPKVRIVPFRGEYFTVREERQDIVRNLLYPVPHPSFPFLGVHFTRLLSGALKVGPNAVLAFAREGYRKSNVNLGELSEAVSYSGFLRLACKHWRIWTGEIARSLSKSAYTHALQRLVPDIRVSDLGEPKSGVRAQCVAPDGSLVDDFHILRGDRAIHVLNVPSPAATAALSIAEYIVDQALDLFEK
jgi:L-2-hydroxyglutarate oxidase LhgO